MKAAIIKEILDKTGADPQAHFDWLNDQSEQYLHLLLKVINALPA